MFSSEKVAIVFGPQIGKGLGGYNWVKLNICKALSEQYRVISVYAEPGVGNGSFPTPVTPADTRLGPFEVEETFIHSTNQWNELLMTMNPTVVIAACDPDKMFVTMSKEQAPFARMFYMLSEAGTITRNWPVGTRQNKRIYIDIKDVLSYIDVVIPGSHVTEHALTEDLEITDKETTLTEVITPPIWKWETDLDRSFYYRKSLGLDPSHRITFTVAANNQRKRLDQVLVYFAWFIRKRGKPCCDRLLIKSNALVDGGYDIPGIANRLGIDKFVFVEENSGTEVLNNIYSAGDTFISLPAAEGYGIPFHEALLLRKQCIHTDVGEPYQTALNLKGQSITVLETDKNPYFHPYSNQLWFNVPHNAKEVILGQEGVHEIEEITNSTEQYQKRILSEVNAAVARKSANVNRG